LTEGRGGFSIKNGVVATARKKDLQSSVKKAKSPVVNGG
jgi:hypothetical protein